jgi:hypothetical protein
VKTSRKASPPAPASKPAVTSIRMRPEDHELIARLQKELGIASVTDLLRQALRALARKEGVSVK